MYDAVPLVPQGRGLGFIPVVISDACGTGSEEAARRFIASLEFAGDALFTTSKAFLERAARP